jgi:hypothetical protein
MAVLDFEDVPAQIAHGREGRLHAEGVLGDASGEFGVVVGNDQQIRIEPVLGGQAGDGGKGLLGLAFHGSAVRDGANGGALVLAQFVRQGQALRLWQCGAERPVAQEHALRIEVRFTVPGQFAANAPEPFQILKSHPVEAVIATQGVDAVLGMTGVVDKIISFVPGPPLGREHDAVDGGHDFGKSRRAAPMTGCPAVHGFSVHQGHQRARRFRVAQHDLFARGILDFDGILGRAGGGRGQFGRDVQGRQRRRLHSFDNRFILGHNS